MELWISKDKDNMTTKRVAPFLSQHSLPGATVYSAMLVLHLCHIFIHLGGKETPEHNGANCVQLLKSKWNKLFD